MTIGLSGQAYAEAERVSFSAARPYSATERLRDDMLAVPGNISVNAEYRLLLETMLARSSTFRRQCLRIANEQSLAVHVRHLPVRLPGGVRAITEISRQSGGAIVARVTLHPFDNDIEMIAHEFEHIIEQLDDVNLAAKARRARSGVRVIDSAGEKFETRRALQMGLKVVQEFRVLTIAQNDIYRQDLDRAPVDVTADGRYLAFTSYSRLVPADTNDRRDVYVLDRQTGSVTLESPAFDGIVPINSDNPSLSDDGRFLVYETHVLSRNAEPLNIVLRDRREASARILSKGLVGEPANGPSRAPVISGDGQLVAFTSAATNLTAGDDASGISEDIYIADVPSGTVRRISVPTADGSGSAGFSSSPAVNATGRYLAFVLSAGNDRDVYIYDANLGTTARVSAGRGGTPPNGRSWAPAISADGKYVAFISAASNLVAGDDNQLPDVFVTDWRSGSTELISRTPKGRSGNDASYNPAISGDGRFIAFQSEASDLVCAVRCAKAIEDINLLWDIFLYDRQTRSMNRISGDDRGPWMEPSIAPALDAMARVVAFSSRHPINGTDRRNDFDLFIVTR